ncbi:mannonate dehydratase [uncultured Hoeflea sp.]|uniref:mannonate dehydratase n=1 Tax=uncultured Hoeflea sp. TaxID=538666 RepID=UPI0026204E12|nr:mannonate dehydratase [uncultured Hoeflea sp.]
MLQSWRWYGPSDPVTLDHVKQAGATGVVSALHHLYNYQRWSLDEISSYKAKINDAGLRWDVCESIPIPTCLKTGVGPVEEAMDVWLGNLSNLGRAGVPVVCFNFMPVLDWTRTNLRWKAPAGGLALRFDVVEMACYDVHILKREGAEHDYDDAVCEAAAKMDHSLDEQERLVLETNLIAGLPGGEGRYTRETLRQELLAYADIDAGRLRHNLLRLLDEAVKVAEKVELKLVIHPDDPPHSLFGLPRVVSSQDDLRAIFDAVPSENNGMVLCTGSFGVRSDFDPVAMVEQFGSRIHFAHLRNVKREPNGSFFESDHLDGSVNMVAAVSALLKEEERRRCAGEPFPEIAMRPDHGHLLIDDIEKQKINPGYSCIGRLKGLAELRGIMQALQHPTVDVSRLAC